MFGHTHVLMRLGLLIIVCSLLNDIFLDGIIQDYAKPFALFFIVVAFLFQYIILIKEFVPGYLVSFLAFLVVWRIASMYSALKVLVPCCFVMLIFLYQISEYILNDLNTDSDKHTISHKLLAWQITLLRMYFGFNMVGHFTEKLFAGSNSYNHLVNEFTALGVTTYTGFIVLLAGLCELGIAIGIGLGVLTRLSALCATLYFLIATLLGHHFYDGFTWANPGGGWEYPMLMMVFYISFIFTGAGKFSIDFYLLKNGFIPKFLVSWCDSITSTSKNIARESNSDI